MPKPGTVFFVLLMLIYGAALYIAFTSHPYWCLAGLLLIGIFSAALEKKKRY